MKKVYKEFHKRKGQERAAGYKRRFKTLSSLLTELFHLSFMINVFLFSKMYKKDERHANPILKECSALVLQIAKRSLD